MRFVGRGHPAVRATHTKTVELSPGDELSERGTCIVAVEATATPPRPMAGPVRIRISAGGRAATIRAVANSSWDPAGPVVIRRSPLRLPGTFAVDADAAAADLPRELITALQDPDALVTVDVVAVQDDLPTEVLFAADPSRPDDPRLLAERAAADSVTAADPAAAALGVTETGDGPRCLRLATAALPVPSREAARIEVVGLPAQLAVIAAAGGGPTVLVPATDAHDALRRATLGTRVATASTPRELVALLTAAQQARGDSTCFAAQQFGPVVRADAEHPPTLFGRDPVHVCFLPAAGDRRLDLRLDPVVDTAIDQLLADGTPSRTVAAALATLAGIPKRAAYDLVLARRDRRS